MAAAPKTYGYSDLFALAKKHGATDAQAQTLAAIALAESSGNASAVNRNANGSTDHGLWQINTVHRGDGFDPVKANNPDYNAAWAVRIMNDAKGFTPWAKYNSQQYLAHLPAGTHVPQGTMASSQPGSGSLKNILDLGMSFIGTPYKWGGNAPGGFDCSGLLQYIFAKNGIAIPRVSQDQGKAGTAVNPQDARAGDLLAFDNNANEPGYDHIGIYLGNGLMLQSPHAGASVEVTKVNLSGVSAIRRIPQASTAGLRQTGNTFVYAARAGQGATSPNSITAASGGGDQGVSGVDTSTLLGADGKINYQNAINKYGYIAEMARTDPSLQKVLTDAISGGWDASTFQAAVRSTPWWRKTTDAQKATADLKATNPAEYKQQRQQMIDHINILSRQLGAAEGTQRVFILAERFMNMGLTPQDADKTIQRYIAADVRVAPTGGTKANTGATAVTVDSLRSQAQAYRINLDDKTLQQWVSNILRGDLGADSFKSYLVARAEKEHPDVPKSAFQRGMTVDDFVNSQASEQEKMTAQANAYHVPLSADAMKKWTTQVVSGDLPPESFTSYVKEQAKSLFPTLGSAIDRGVTVEQYVDPYRQATAQTLEVAPDSVDFINDPTYSKALANVDPKTGQRAAMNLSDYQTYLRTLPQYRKTHQATQSAAEFTNQLLDTFGKVSN